MSKQDDTMAILKLYELRRDPEMRAARQWYFSEFAPKSAMDIVNLYRDGERAVDQKRQPVIEHRSVRPRASPSRTTTPFETCYEPGR